MTGVYLISTSAATLIVSYVSGSIIQLTAWHRLWDSLLRGIGGPSGGTLQIGHWVDELLAHNFPPTRWVVPGYFPEGLAMLAGRPKIGKSWLALQRVHAISSGGPIFNESIEPAPVLYIAFEDAARRLKKRMKAQAWPGLSTKATFYSEWPPLDRGGLEQLQHAMVEGLYRLVVIDPVSRVRHRP